MKVIYTQIYVNLVKLAFKGCHGRNRMVVGFPTNCAISAYQH